MGLVTNYPLAIASGMGLNAVVAFQLIAAQKLPWPAAMGVIFLEGVVITVLVLVGVREAVVNAIPLALKRAISVGIGLFILFIGLVNGGIVRPGQGIPVTLGAVTSPKVLVAVAGLLLTLLFLARGARAALLLGILGTTILAILVNALHGGTVWTIPGVAVVPRSLVAWPDFSTLGAGINFEVFARLGVLAACLAIFSIMLSDFFDTMGTVIGIGAEARWLDKAGRLPRMNRVLLVDSLAAAIGGAASASSATTYIESAAGVAAGGRTGLTSVVVARVLRARPLRRAAGGGRARGGDGAGPHHRGLPHVRARAGDPVRGPGGGLPGAPDHDDHAVLVLHHQRDRGGLRELRGHQARPRPGRRRPPAHVRGGGGVPAVLRAPLGAPGGPAERRAGWSRVVG